MFTSSPGRSFHYLCLSHYALSQCLAPTLRPSDHKDFVGYYIAWVNCVGRDHAWEEIHLSFRPWRRLLDKRVFSIMSFSLTVSEGFDTRVDDTTSKGFRCADSNTKTPDSPIYHDDMQKLKNHLLSFEHFRDPETQITVSRLLSLMDKIALPLHTHLASVPHSLLALSRFSTPKRPNH